VIAGLRRWRHSGKALTATAVVLAGSCAQVEGPPGGPEDRDPPGILTTRPDTGAVVPDFDGAVAFVFDERISERGVEEAVMVSPRTSPVVVQHSRDEVRVSLRQGWLPGQVYHVSLGPGVIDLFGNPLGRFTTIVFSTGPPIPSTRSSGVVTDRITGRPQPGVRVEAIRSADSLVYAVPSDSAGSFVIDRIPAGEYQFRAFQDINRSRSLELFEPRDSAFGVVGDTPLADISLSLLLPDSTPPVAGSASLQQRRIQIEFDDYLDADQPLDPSRVVVADSAGVPIEVTGVSVGPFVGATAPAEPGDTAATPARRAPSRLLFVQLADSAELVPESEYIVNVESIRNVNGLAADAEASFTTPPAPPTPVALVPRRVTSRYIASRRARARNRPQPLNFVVEHG